MTKSQLRSKQNQVIHSHQEFRTAWNDAMEKAPAVYKDLFKCDMESHAEQMAWLVFKKAKGL